jgi:hypothetical protein
MLKFVRDFILKRGLATAAEIGAEAAATATSKTFVQRFEVQFPVTIFVRGSHVEAHLLYTPGTVVELKASLRASFGWEFATEQDEAGVYIVAKRKPLVGALSAATFTLTVPPEANLAFHLTPGSVRLAHVDGKLTVPALH